MKLTKEQLADIRSDNRKVPVAALRHAVCLKLAEKGRSEEEIGQFVNRNHSTVHHSKNKAKELLEINDTVMVQAYSEL